MKHVVDLRHDHGPALTTVQLADACGVSDQKIRNEIIAGELIATNIGKEGRRPEYRIAWQAARRWAIRLGFITAS